MMSEPVVEVDLEWAAWIERLWVRDVGCSGKIVAAFAYNCPCGLVWPRGWLCLYCQRASSIVACVTVVTRDQAEEMGLEIIRDARPSDCR